MSVSIEFIGCENVVETLNDYVFDNFRPTTHLAWRIVLESPDETRFPIPIAFASPQEATRVQMALAEIGLREWDDFVRVRNEHGRKWLAKRMIEALAW